MAISAFSNSDSDFRSTAMGCGEAAPAPVPACSSGGDELQPASASTTSSGNDSTNRIDIAHLHFLFVETGRHKRAQGLEAFLHPLVVHPVPAAPHVDLVQRNRLLFEWERL